MEKILNKIKNGIDLTRKDALEMLSVDISNPYYHQIIALADSYSRKTFDGKGFIFTQIGLDYQACSVNCKFCSLAKDSFTACNTCATKKSMDEIITSVKNAVANNTDELFLMTTAEYNKLEYLDVVKSVRKHIPQNMRLVANIGDFNFDYALKLREAGITGVYHICRLNEGVDTDVSVDTRMKTLEAIKQAGLELYYCVEPIGAEHTNEQIVDEIFRTLDFNVGVMAVMKRVGVKGTPLENAGEIPSHRLALICAVTCLCAKPHRAMGVHEPDLLCLMAGANQIYAEVGVNPRDNTCSTEDGRGFSIQKARQLFFQSGWQG